MIEGAIDAAGATLAHVVPTLISSISINGVVFDAACLKNTCEISAKSVPVPPVADIVATGSIIPNEGFIHNLAASFKVPLTI